MSQDAIDRFDEHRSRLRAVAYRMLGSLSDAEDAVQEAWLRASRADTSDVANPAAWWTTVIARVCLNMLRARDTRREEPLEAHLPDPVVGPAATDDPEQETVLADTVGLALLVVLDTLGPDERLAFVLHDTFAVPFEEIAPVLRRSVPAVRQLARRARRRVRDAAPRPDRDPARQRAAVDAYFAAVREGDFDALLAVLHPDVVLRADGGAALARQSLVLRGAHDVAAQAARARSLAPLVRPVLVNGAAGAVAVADGRAVALLSFTVVDGRIVTVEVLVDPDRLAALDVPAPAGGAGG